MKRSFVLLLLHLILTACSNSSDLETGEIKAIKNLRDTLLASNTPTRILDTRNVISRKKIDDAKIPVLFIELQNGQNGTLTLYPGQGVGETWLGADGATVTLENGVIKATRGMRGDVMGSTSSMPSWADVKDTSEYTREISHLLGNNQTESKTYSCIIERDRKRSFVTIFDVEFSVQKHREICTHDAIKLTNVYFVDNQTLVRKSIQYHGPVLGHVTIERLDR
jgi:hypothetical protein